MIFFILIDKKQEVEFKEEWHVTGTPKTAKERQIASSFSGKLHVVDYNAPVRRYDATTLTQEIKSGYEWAVGTLPTSRIFLPTNKANAMVVKGYIKRFDQVRVLLDSVWNYFPDGVVQDVYNEDGQLIQELPKDNLYIAPLWLDINRAPGLDMSEEIYFVSSGVFKTYLSTVTVGSIENVPQLLDYYPPSGDWKFTPAAAKILGNMANSFKLEDNSKRIFRDSIFSLDIPKFGTENNFEEYGIQSNFVTIKPTYNHYLRAYEKNLPDIDERLLYNIYTLLSQIEVEASKNPNKYVISSTNPSSLPEAAAYKKYLNLTNSKILGAFDKTSLADLGTLLNNFGSFYKEDPPFFGGVIPEDVRELKKSKFAFVGVSINSMELFKKANENKNKFPMYIELDILTQNTGNLLQMLKKSGFFDRLMKYIMVKQRAHSERFYHEEIGVPFGKDFKGTPASLFLDEPMYATTLEGEQLDIPNKAVDFIEGTAAKGRSEPLMRVNIEEFIVKGKHKMQQPYAASPNLLDNEWTREHVELYGEKTSETLKFLDIIKIAKFKLGLTKFIGQNKRTIKDIYKGKAAYSEVLFYEVIKYKVTKEFFETNDISTAEFVQSMFIPNDTESIITKYIDTQVKLGTHYFYQIYAHTAVLGNEYTIEEFSNLDNLPAGQQTINEPGIPKELGYTWNLNYSNKPMLELVRVPYYNTVASTAQVIQTNPDTQEASYLYSNLEDTIIKDHPPVFPNVNIIPFKGLNNKILINLNYSTGEYEMVPVIIDDSEEEAVDELLRSQNKMTVKFDGKYSNKLLFKTDEHAGTFQVLRIDKLPSSYKDFGPASDTSRALTTENSLTDSIAPNKDYYYTFRVIDAHGHLSNPTPIYHVRIVDEEGFAPYTVIKSFFIDEVQEETKKKEINLMKYVQIKPALGQTRLDMQSLDAHGSALNVDATTIAENLPQVKEKVFGKNFKFRFTSKRTGKKFDLKVVVNGISVEERVSQTAGGTNTGNGNGST